MKDWQARISGEEQHRPNDRRNVFQRDRARVLHSSAFRRLQSKTQIVAVGQNDFPRTRLTHSLEVAQIGTGILAQLQHNELPKNVTDVKQYLPCEHLVESLCFAHDIGHPPFGHGGEIALNYVMRNDNGFEANGQTFRIVGKLEPYTKEFGMDLTRRTLLGLIKYPQCLPEKLANSPSSDSHLLKAADWKPTKGLFIDDRDLLDWTLEPISEREKTLFVTSKNNKTLYKSLDASIMELADDIAYAVHDLEDAIVLNHVTKEMWYEQALPSLKSIPNMWSQKYSDQLSKMLFSSEQYERKNAIGALVNQLITNIDVTITHPEFEHGLLKYNVLPTETAKPLLDVLKRFVYQNVIMATDIQQVEFKGQRMLIALFEAFSSDPERLLPNTIKDIWRRESEFNRSGNRVICDYIANMSDEQATRVYKMLYANID